MSSFRFLDLPTEIRDLVYRHVFHPAVNRSKDRDAYVRYRYSLGLARTSRQVQAEAMAVFFRLNTFVAIETPWLVQEHVEREGYVPLLVRNSAAAHLFRHHSLTVAIDAPLHADAFPPDAAQRVVIHADDLPAFADFWMYQALTYPDLNRHMRLTLRLRNPHPRGPGDDEATPLPLADQRRLLAPFGVVKQLWGVIVIGSGTNRTYQGEEEERKREMASRKRKEERGTRYFHNVTPIHSSLPLPTASSPSLSSSATPSTSLGSSGDDDNNNNISEVEKELREAMERPYRPAEECLDEAAALREEGNVAFNAGRFREAIGLYEASFRSLHIVCDGRRRSVFADSFFNRDMRSGRFKGQNGAMQRLMLRVRLVAAIVAALLRLGDLEHAKFWGMRTIELLRAEVEFDVGGAGAGAGGLGNGGGGGNGNGTGVGNVTGNNGADDGNNDATTNGNDNDDDDNNNAGIDDDIDDDAEEEYESALDFPAASDMGKIYFRTGVACKRLGQHAEARRLLRVAMAYLPNDPDIRQEHASVAMKMNGGREPAR